MSDLIAVAYDDLRAAEEARDRLVRLQREHSVELSDIAGVDDDFMRDLGAHLVPGAAALFVLVEKRNPDKVVPELAPLGGKLMRTSLTDEDEQHLREAVEAARRTHQPV